MNWLPAYAVSMCRHGTSCTLIILLLCVLLLAVPGSFSIADDSPRQTSLESVYEYAGVHAHLSWVHSTVADETQLAGQRCENDKSRSAMAAMLEENLSIDVLRQGFLDELDQRISDEQLEQIISWTQSEAGKNIYQAELESLDFDESDFDSMLETYKQSGVHGDKRNMRLKHMLADTGAVYFLSALNTELSALVAIVSVCSNNEAELAAAQKQIREERGAEALYRSFMRQELIVPSALVYRNISNEQLDALSAFAKSDAGDAYYTALIKGTRSLLAGKVDRLSELLETMPSSVD